MLMSRPDGPMSSRLTCGRWGTSSIWCVPRSPATASRSPNSCATRKTTCGDSVRIWVAGTTPTILCKRRTSARSGRSRASRAGARYGFGCSQSPAESAPTRCGRTTSARHRRALDTARAHVQPDIADRSRSRAAPHHALSRAPRGVRAHAARRRSVCRSGDGLSRARSERFVPAWLAPAKTFSSSWAKPRADVCARADSRTSRMSGGESSR